MNNLKNDPWECVPANHKVIDGEELNNILSGFLIEAAEPIDYPLTDGIILNVKRPETGERFEVVIEIPGAPWIDVLPETGPSLIVHIGKITPEEPNIS